MTGLCIATKNPLMLLIGAEYGECREWLTGKFFPLGDAAGDAPTLET